MNKQLLTATLVAAISSITFAETPNYDSLSLPIDFQQFCGQQNTQNCQEIAKLMVIAQELLTEEQSKRIEELHTAISQEITASREFGIKLEEQKENNILGEAAEAAKKTSEEIAQELHTQENTETNQE